MRRIFAGFRHRTAQWGMAFLLSAAILLTGSAAFAQIDPNARDCDDNAVIRCGALGPTELINKYNENQGGNTQALFTHFGIPSAEDMRVMVEGSVNAATNEVVINGRVVATEAVTAGRQNISNERGQSTPILNGAFYERPPSVSFANPNGSLRALVRMENDTFKFAILTSCGNPVRAKPVPPPPPPPPPPPAPVEQPPQPPVKPAVIVKPVKQPPQPSLPETGINPMALFVIVTMGAVLLRSYYLFYRQHL